MPRSVKPPRIPPPEATETAILRKVLAAAAPRPAPTAAQPLKNKYAVRFADKMAEAMAKDFESFMPGITATTKRSSVSARGKKQLDINFSTPHLGLALGISLKSVHLRENEGAKRYTHNMKRNEEELRIEASGYHKRQPYAVMVGVLFLPFDSCTDGKRGNPSSFGSWVRHLRPYVGRSEPTDDGDRFEELYIALYQPDGTELRFFDARSAPPKNGRPRDSGDLFGSEDAKHSPQRLLTYPEFLARVHHAYLRRNVAEFAWADGETEPLAPDELDPIDE